MHSPIQQPSFKIPSILDVSLYRRDISDALQKECGRSLIAALKTHPRLHFLFNQPARVLEGYSIQSHTEMVLTQFDSVFSSRALPARMLKGDFILTLALHDIGKSIPEDINDQHRATTSLIRCIRDHLPFSDHGYTVGMFLISGDQLGKTIQSTLKARSQPSTREKIATAARLRPLTGEEINSMTREVVFHEMEGDRYQPATHAAICELAKNVVKTAQSLKVDPVELFELLVIYFQCDTSAYTYGAKSYSGELACPGLDYLFVRGDPSVRENYLQYSPDKRRLAFIPHVELILDAVDTEIRMPK